MIQTKPFSNGSSTASSRERFDVVVIGAGQAGLAIGHFLAHQGRRFVILEAADSIGSAWRTRWDSLRPVHASPLLTRLPGSPSRGPGRLPDARRGDRLPRAVRGDVRAAGRARQPVRSLAAADGRFVLELDDRRLEADQVVVATGPFQVPHVPALAEQLAPEVFQTHSTGYRRPSDVPEGTVLVVGGGNTGYQIAKELVGDAQVHLAVGSRQKPLPQRLLGRDLFWWLTKTGLIKKTVDSRIGRRASQRDTLIGSSPRELKRRYGVELRPRVVAASERTVSFADGSELDVDAVIWATGYRPDYSWIELPVLDPEGRVRHRRGVTEVPGLYFLGLSWQHTRGSALHRLGQGRRRVHRRADRRKAKHASSRARPQDQTLARQAAAARKERTDEQQAPRRSQPTSELLPDRHRRPSRGARLRGRRARRRRRGSSCGSRRWRSGSATRPCACSPTTARFPARRCACARARSWSSNVVNEGDLEATVHWHGLRLDNRYDGTHETQAPIPVGGTFSYRIEFPDPGVYWYHPHIREDYGQEMGLYGNILVVPADPDYWPPAHREVLLTLDDVLIEDGKIAPFSRDETTYAAMGRFGNVLLVGGETELVAERAARRGRSLLPDQHREHARLQRRPAGRAA